MEHAADLGVTGMTAAREHDAAPRADAHDVAPLVDVAVLPEALHELARLGMLPRRVARLDADDSARRRLRANELVERAVQHELHALLARREFERPRERGAVAERAGPDDAARVVHLHRGEGARALGIGLARVRGRDRAGLHVRLVAEREEADRAARARHAAARVRAVDAREADVVVHEELPRGSAILGPGADETAFVVAVRAIAVTVDDRPVREVLEQDLDAVVELGGFLDRLDLDAPFGVALAVHVAALHGVPRAERDERAAVQHSAADVEGRLDDEHGGAEIARPDRGREPGAACADYDDVVLVVPAVSRAGLSLRALRTEQRSGPEPGGRGRDDVSPRDAGVVGVIEIVRVLVCSSRHVPPG